MGTSDLTLVGDVVVSDSHWNPYEYERLEEVDVLLSSSLWVQSHVHTPDLLSPDVD